jgi:hypothetical protein
MTSDEETHRRLFYGIRVEMVEILKGNQDNVFGSLEANLDSHLSKFTRQTTRKLFLSQDSVDMPSNDNGMDVTTLPNNHDKKRKISNNERMINSTK